MSRTLLRKRSDQFILAQSFPENIQPTKKISRRVDKAFSKTRFRLGDVLKKGESSCVQQFLEGESRGGKGRQGGLPTQNNNLPFQFLFSLDEIKSSLSKGGGQGKKESEFKLQLKEKRKIAFLYGNLTSRELKKALNTASHFPGRSHDNLLVVLESRLDVVLYRLGFHKSLVTARQCIAHGGVLVNGKSLTIPSYSVQAGDILSIHPRSEKRVRNQMLKSWSRESRLSSFWRFTLSPGIVEGVWTQKGIPAKDSTDPFPLGFSKESPEDSSLYASEAVFKRLGAKRLSAPRDLHKSFPSNSLVPTPMKPLHLEVSYKSLTGIFLFSPQKLAFPATLNPDLIRKHIQK